MQTQEFRLDTGYTTSEWEIDNNGFLVVNATIARIGVQQYKNEDGTIRREFRPPEEVSKIESLKTFKMLPHCLEHPPLLLNDTNAKYFLVGFTGDDPIYENGYINTKIKIIDKDAKEQALSGERREISCGYTCRLEWTSGEYNGEKYDCIQRDIKGNHTCQTIKGRAGKEVKIHIDSLNESIDINNDYSNTLKERIEQLKRKESQILIEKIQLKGGLNEYIIKNDGKLDDLIVTIETDTTENKEVKFKMSRNVFAETQGMSDTQKAAFLMSAYNELFQENQSLRIQKTDAEREAALHEGRADRWRNELDSVKSGGNYDSDNSYSGEQTESLKRQIKEKQIRCDHLESELSDTKRQLTEVQRELRESKSRNDTLASELTELNQTKRKEIINARQDWLKAYQRVSPFLPENAKNELQTDPTIADNRIALYRLAIQNVKPHVDLSNKTDSYIEGQFESIEDDFRNRSKMGNNLLSDKFRVAVDSVKNNVPQHSNNPVQDLHQLRLSSMQETAEAWKMTN